MGLSVVGRHASTTIAGGAYDMWVHGQAVTAAIVAFCAVIAPAGYILFMLTLLLAVRRPPAPQWVGEMLRMADFMRPWSMQEVMMLGILVALIKIAELATVNAGIGMYAVGAVVLLFPAIMVSFDPAEIWQRVQWADGSPPPTSRRSVRHRGSIERSSRNQDRNRYFTRRSEVSRRIKNNGTLQRTHRAQTIVGAGLNPASTS